MESKDPATNMLDDLDERFERMEWRIEGVEARLGKRIDGVERTQARIDSEQAQGEARLEGASARLDRRIDDVCDSLGRRTTESEVRLATAINHFAGTLHDVHRLLQDRFGRRKLPNN
jgi:hypothetical protein